MRMIIQPAATDRLGDRLNENFDKPWSHFRAAIAFVKLSGAKHIAKGLAEFSTRGSVEILAGIDHRGSSSEGLATLLTAVSKTDSIYIFHNPLWLTFHPKVYIFKSDLAANVIVGSGNLTEGGLYTNYEASVEHLLDLTDAADKAFLESLEESLDAWFDVSKGTVLPLTEELLTKLVALGLVPLEALSASKNADSASDTDDDGETNPFSGRAEFKAPTVSRPPAIPTSPAPLPILPPATTGYVMTLQRTDVGVGQTTPGASRRSPEIFIPLAARNQQPAFWGWNSMFIADATNPGKYDRSGVKMRLGGSIILVNMMTWPQKSDFRLRSSDLRDSGNIGDILRLEKAPASASYDYYVEIIPPATTQYATYFALCNNAVRNSAKRFGYY